MCKNEHYSVVHRCYFGHERRNRLKRLTGREENIFLIHASRRLVSLWIGGVRSKSTFTQGEGYSVHDILMACEEKEPSQTGRHVRGKGV